MKVSFGPWQLCNRHRWLEKIEITSTMHHTVSWTHKSFLNIQEKKLTYIHKPFHSLSFSLSIYLSAYLSIYKEENCRRGATWEEEEREQEGKEGDIREVGSLVKMEKKGKNFYDCLWTMQGWFEKEIFDAASFSCSYLINQCINQHVSIF